MEVQKEPRMVFTMVGISNSGKSTFMSALHRKFKVPGVNGFTLLPIPPHAKDYSEEALRKAAQEWYKWTWDYNNMNFVEATQKTRYTRFNLMYGEHIVTRFDWVDYRGGAIENIFGDASADQDELEVLDRIRESQVFLIFVDALTLTGYGDDEMETIARHTGINHITALFHIFNRFEKYRKRNFIFLFVITRCDTVEDQWKASEYASVVRRAKQALSPFIGLIRDNPYWQGGILPISATGEGTTQRKGFQSGTFRTPPIAEYELIKEPKPINIEHALFYCLGAKLSLMRDFTTTRINVLGAEQQALLQQIGILETLINRIRGTKTAGEQVVEKAEESRLEHETLLTYLPYINPLLTTALEKVERIK